MWRAAVPADRAGGAGGAPRGRLRQSHRGRRSRHRARPHRRRTVTRPEPTSANGRHDAWPLNGELGDYIRNLGNCLELVAISHNQRGHAPDLPWAGVVHNAVPVQRFPFSAHKEDYALFLGRCSPEKAPHQAILSARAAGIPLVAAAKCVEGPEQEYFARKVRPLLGPDVTWLGEVGGREKMDLLRRARCLLFPIAWEEPFGMVMIEALACGTPVVALRRGAVPEVIEHGRTGLHTTDPAELPRLLQHVVSMDPADCRAEALARFDVAAMVRGYEEVYQDVLARRRAPMHSTRPVRHTPALEDVG